MIRFRNSLTERQYLFENPIHESTNHSNFSYGELTHNSHDSHIYRLELSYIHPNSTQWHLFIGIKYT